MSGIKEALERGGADFEFGQLCQAAVARIRELEQEAEDACAAAEGLRRCVSRPFTEQEIEDAIVHARAIRPLIDAEVVRKMAAHDSGKDVP